MSPVTHGNVPYNICSLNWNALITDYQRLQHDFQGLSWELVVYKHLQIVLYPLKFKSCPELHRFRVWFCQDLQEKKQRLSGRSRCSSSQQGKAESPHRAMWAALEPACRRHSRAGCQAGRPAELSLAGDVAWWVPAVTENLSQTWVGADVCSSFTPAHFYMLQFCLQMKETEGGVCCAHRKYVEEHKQLHKAAKLCQVEAWADEDWAVKSLEEAVLTIVKDFLKCVYLFRLSTLP